MSIDPVRLAEEIEAGTDTRPAKLGRTAYWMAPDERRLLAAALRLAHQYVTHTDRFDVWKAKILLAEEAYKSAARDAT